MASKIPHLVDNHEFVTRTPGMIKYIGVNWTAGENDTLGST